MVVSFRPFRRDYGHPEEYAVPYSGECARESSPTFNPPGAGDFFPEWPRSDEAFGVEHVDREVSSALVETLCPKPWCHLRTRDFVLVVAQD